MTPKVKKVLAVLLVLGVAIVWIPQLLSANTKIAPRVLLELPANGVAPSNTTPEKLVPLGAADAATADAANSTADAAARSNTTDGSASPAGSLEATLAKAKFLLPERNGLDLDRLAMAWSAPGEATVVTPAPVPDATRAGESEVARPPFDTVQTVDPVAAFLSSHPLQGTLIGTSQRLANLGPIVVRVGDEPLKGLVVTAIEARWVTLEHDGQTVRSELIPFQARAASKSSPIGSSSGSTNTPPSPGTPDPALNPNLPPAPSAPQSAAGASKTGATASDSQTPAPQGTATITDTAKEPHGS